MPQDVSKQRFWFVVVLVCLFFSLIIYQLVQLTIIRRDSLTEAAHRQHNMTIKIPSLRGPILDRDGKELATNLKLPSIYAVPRILTQEQKSELVAQLSYILKISSKNLMKKFNRPKAFVWIKRQASLEEAAQIKALNSRALGIIEEYKRFYPQNDLLAQVIGFTNIDTEGLEGVELSYNEELSGQDGKRYTKRDALGREIRAFETKSVPARDGHKVVLTIDSYLQYIAEKSLDEAFLKWKAKAASAVIMDAKTGEILALVNRPTFDLNHRGQSKKENRRNRVITDMYEPGSVFKIVATSAALNEGKAKTDDVFFCENGQYRYGRKILRDAHGYGDLTFEEVMIKSSNIGTVKIAALLEPEKFQDYIEAFGFGQKTGFDLPGEVSGFTRPPSQWSSTSPYNIPMGHEILVTVLQMVRAFGVIANEGKLMKPYVIDRVEDHQGVALAKKEPEVARQVIKPEVANTMRDILVRVVDEGTGRRAQIDGVKVGGKTGTAQKVLEGGGGYSHEDFISSFIGFAPAEDPKFIVGVVLDDPGPKYYGGTVAAPVVKSILEAALVHAGYVPPKEAEEAIPDVDLEGVQEISPIAE
jgi:cell division protein FtsI (penicillin-binding protein 3)